MEVGPWPRQAIRAKANFPPGWGGVSEGLRHIFTCRRAFRTSTPRHSYDLTHMIRWVLIGVPKVERRGCFLSVSQFFGFFLFLCGRGISYICEIGFPGDVLFKGYFCLAAWVYFSSIDAGQERPITMLRQKSESAEMTLHDIHWILNELFPFFSWTKVAALVSPSRSVVESTLRPIRSMAWVGFAALQRPLLHLCLTGLNIWSLLGFIRRHLREIGLCLWSLDTGNVALRLSYCLKCI